MTEDITLQLQNIFFSKDTIATCNKSLLAQGNLNDVSRDNKQEIINLLVKNMKMVYRSIDINRINKSNFNSIYEQFKKNSISESINEIKKSKISSSENNDSKFQRDFNSIPSNGNKIMDRPNATKTNIIPQKKEQNNFDSTLDKVFKPIVDIKPEENMFNNYSNNRGKDINSRMEEIQSMRQIEINGQNNRPKTPDFLKSKPTNPDRIDKQNTSNNSNNNSNSNSNSNNSNFNFNNNFNNNDKGFVGLVNDIGGDLFNIDNIDRPLIEEELIEDSNPFEDRLKRLQSERENITIQPSQNQIDFTSNTFQTNNNISDNTFQSNNNRIDVNRTEIKTNDKDEVNRTNDRVDVNRTNDRVDVNRTNDRIDVHRTNDRVDVNRTNDRVDVNRTNDRVDVNRTNDRVDVNRTNDRVDVNRTNDRVDVNRTNDRVDVNRTEIKTSTPLSKLEEIKNSMKSVNIPLREDIQKLERENNNLQQIILDLQNSKNEELKNIKESISLEFEELRKKEQLINSKESNITYKENFINNKEEELKKLIKRHEDLMKIKQVQLEVNNDKNISEYTFNIGTDNYNVIGIKLISYHLPVTKYNIENYNNKIEYKIDDEIKTIQIKNGKYTIEQLLNKLNNEDLEFILNTEQTITIKSDKKFSLINTELLNINLGFNKINDNIVTISDDNITSFDDNITSYNSDKIYDLRIDDKIYLYLNNLSEEPFGILYSNGMSVCNFQFENSYKLSKLDITFKNNKGHLYNFYDLSHNMSFILDII